MSEAQPAALSGTYSDLKTIRSRKVVQMVVEFPIEQGARVVETFGFPNPGEEKWVAVAMLKSQPTTEPEADSASHRAKKHFEAACQGENFQAWIAQKTGSARPLTADETRAAAKRLMGIKTASAIIAYPEKWRELYQDFKYRQFS